MSTYPPIPPGGWMKSTNPNTNAGFGQTSPRLTVSTDTSGYVMHMDTNRLWYIYQVGSRLVKFTCSVLDSDIAKFTSGTGVQIALHVPPDTQLQPYEKIFMWCPATDQLIQTEHTQADWGLTCHYVGQYTGATRPFVAKNFQLGEMDVTPEFKSGEEALEWMEKNS